MANHYTSTGSVTRYNRLLPGSSDGAFRGADFSSEASLVDRTRLAFVRNMWRDYESENGGCIETSPGFRLCKLIENNGKAHGLWDYRYNGADYVICHMGRSLYAIRHDSRDSGISDLPVPVSTAVADADSQAFVFNGKFYLLDGTTYWVMNGVSSLSAVSSGSPYVPITYSDEEEYEQRNMLTDSFVERWNVPDVSARMTDANYGVVLSLDETTATATVTAINSTRQVLYIPGSYTIDDVTYDTVNIAAGAFQGNKRLKKVVILKCGVIGENAFNGCSSLNSVTIHSFSEIQANAFANTPVLYETWLGGNGIISATAFESSDNEPAMRLYLTRSAESEITSNRVIKLLNCSMYEGVAGDTLSLRETYQTYPLVNVESNSGSYIGTPHEPLSDGGSWAVDLLRPRSKVDLLFRGGASVGPKYVAVTIVGKDGSIFSDTSTTDGAALTSESEDTACAADFYILDPCTSITQVTIQGSVTAGKEQAVEVWYNHSTRIASGKTIDSVNCEAYKDGTSYYTRIRLFAKSPGLLSDIVLKLRGIAKAGEFKNSGAANFADASGGYTGSSKAAINGCRVCTVFDGRPFFTGNPDFPNTVFYCGRRSDTGTIDPGYIGVCSFFNDGTGNCRNNALLSAGSVLMVFKERSGVEGSIFYHSPRETGLDFLPKDYPSVEGASGYDCLGAAYNFLDDYVFVTASGVSAVDKQQLNLERTIGHRSSNIDRLLAGKDLSKAKLCEWKGYLILCCAGEIFLADSRKMFENNTGGVEYEWFRFTDVGYWRNQYVRYQTMTGGVVHGLPITQYQLVEYGVPTGKFLKASEEARQTENYTLGTFIATKDDAVYSVTIKYDPHTMEAITATDEYVGGYFCPARYVLNLGGVLYFSFDNGGICCFNTDKRGINFCTFGDSKEELYIEESGVMTRVLTQVSDDVVQSGETILAYTYNEERGYRAYGEIPIYRGEHGIYRLELPLNPVSRYEMDSHWYTYCGRRYSSEMATCFDDCGSPFLAKNTIHDSLVISAKVMRGSRFDLLVRTERDEWKVTERIAASAADFTDLRFDAHSFRSRHELILKSKERAKKWVKKQLCFRVDCYRTPFGIYNLGYGYTIYGKVKT